MIDPASVFVSPWRNKRDRLSNPAPCSEIDLITNRIPLLHISTDHAADINSRIQQSLHQVENVRAYETSIMDNLQNLLGKLTGKEIPPKITENIARQLLLSGPDDPPTESSESVIPLSLDSRRRRSAVVGAVVSPPPPPPPPVVNVPVITGVPPGEDPTEELLAKLKEEQEGLLRSKLQEHDEEMRYKMTEVQSTYETRLSALKAELNAQKGKETAVVHGLQAELQETKRQQKRQEQAVKEYETLLKAKGEFSTSLQNTLRQSQTQLIHFKEQVEKLKSTNARAEITKQKFKEDMSDVKVKLERLQHLVKFANDELSKEQRLRSILETELNEQRDFLILSEKLIEDAESRAAEADERIRKINADEQKATEYLAVVGEFRGRLNHLEQVSAEVRESLDQNDDYRLRVDTILEEDQRVLQDQDNYVSEVFTQMSALSNFCAKQTKEIEVLKDSLRKSVQSLELKDEVLKQTITEKETAKLYLPLEQQKTSHLEEALVHIRADRDHLEIQLRKTNDQLLVAKQALSSTSAQAKVANSQSAVLEPVVKSLQDELTEALREREELKAKVAGSNIRIADLESQKAKLVQEFEEDRERCERIWKDAYATIEKRLKQQQEQHEQLVSILRDTVPPGTSEFIANLLPKRSHKYHAYDDDDDDDYLDSSIIGQSIEAIVTTEGDHGGKDHKLKLTGVIKNLDLMAKS